MAVFVFGLFAGKIYSSSDPKLKAAVPFLMEERARIFENWLHQVKQKNSDKSWVNLHKETEIGLKDLYVRGEQNFWVYELLLWTHLSNSNRENERENEAVLNFLEKKAQGALSQLVEATPQVLNFVILSLVRDLTTAGVEDEVTICEGVKMSASNPVILATNIVTFLISKLSADWGRECKLTRIKKAFERAARDCILFYDVFEIEKLQKKLDWGCNEKKLSLYISKILSTSFDLVKPIFVFKSTLHTDQSSRAKICSLKIVNTCSHRKLDLVPRLHMEIAWDPNYASTPKGFMSIEYMELSAIGYSVNAILRGGQSANHSLFLNDDVPIYWNVEYEENKMEWQGPVPTGFLNEDFRYKCADLNELPRQFPLIPYEKKKRETCPRRLVGKKLPSSPPPSVDFLKSVGIPVDQNSLHHCPTVIHGIFNGQLNKGSQRAITMQGKAYLIPGADIYPESLNVSINDKSYGLLNFKVRDIIEGSAIFEANPSEMDQERGNNVVTYCYNADPNARVTKKVTEVDSANSAKTALYLQIYRRRVFVADLKNGTKFVLVPTNTWVKKSGYGSGGVILPGLNVFIGTIDKTRPFQNSRYHKLVVCDSSIEIDGLISGELRNDAGMIFNGTLCSNVAGEGGITTKDNTIIGVKFDPVKTQSGIQLATPPATIKWISFPDEPQQRNQVIDYTPPEVPERPDLSGDYLYDISEKFPPRKVNTRIRYRRQNSPEEKDGRGKSNNSQVYQCRLEMVLRGLIPTITRVTK
jgi:hypothetical protein